MRTEKGSTLAIDGAGSALHLSSLRIDRIAAHATLAGDAGRLDATVHGVHAGPRSIANLTLATQFTLGDHPRADLQIHGTTGRALPATTATISAHYAAGRVRGDLTATVLGQRFDGSFALPASPTGGGPIAGRARFDAEVARLPVALLALFPPALLAVRSGHVSGSLSLGGTWRRPLLSVQASGRDLAGAHFDHLDLTLSGTCDAAAAHARARVTLRGMPLANLRATAALSSLAPTGTSLLSRWREIPIEVAGEVPGYPLALVPEVAQRIGGVVEGTLALSGTPGHPTGRASLHVTGLHLGEVQFDRFAAELRMSQSGATVKIDAAARTGKVLLTADLPLAATAPWHLEAHAVEFPLDLHALPLSGLRSAQGTINAELLVSGTRAQPILTGLFRARQGVIGFGESSFPYDHGVVDLTLTGERLTLRELSFSAAGGTFAASGAGRLSGLRPVAFEGLAHFKNYPVALKGVNGWLTANLDLHVQTEDAGLSGRVVVKDGLLRLADLSRVRSVQSTAMPPGVHYVDAAGKREAAARQVAVKLAQVKVVKLEKLAQVAAAVAAADPNAAPEATLAVIIPGPFRVEGKEVHATLKGELHIQHIQNDPRISGVIESTTGYVDLLGRRYELELLNVDFDGSPMPDPQLDVRITRESDVTVVVEVQGAASHPDVIFSSIPPTYSEEQVMAMILSGSPSATDAGSESLDDRVAGALSGTFVGQLKDQLLPTLPIDVIKVDLATNSRGQEDTRFEVGKYLTESIYVSYVHQLGAVLGLRRLNRNQLQLEYRFARHFEVETSYGDNGVGALDLYWDHRF